MATKTTNYNLTKPDLNDIYDLSVGNSNLDKIDAKLKALDDKAFIPGPMGPKGEDGKGLEILGYYTSLEDLQAGRPTAEAGAIYAVGTPENNVLYIWDENKEAWQSLGSLRGPAGPQGQTGPQGMPGQAGINGVAVATSGCIAFNVTEDGDLTVSYPDENSAPDFRLDESGCLVYEY